MVTVRICYSLCKKCNYHPDLFGLSVDWELAPVVEEKSKRRAHHTHRHRTCAHAGNKRVQGGVFVWKHKRKEKCFTLLGAQMEEGFNQYYF